MRPSGPRPTTTVRREPAPPRAAPQAAVPPPVTRTITLAEGMTGMMENVFINVKNKSKTITAEMRQAVNQACGAQPGDLLLFQFGKEAVVQTVMANLRVHLGKKLGLVPATATLPARAEIAGDRFHQAQHLTEHQHSFHLFQN